MRAMRMTGMDTWAAAADYQLLFPGGKFTENPDSRQEKDACIFQTSYISGNPGKKAACSGFPTAGVPVCKESLFSEIFPPPGRSGSDFLQPGLQAAICLYNSILLFPFCLYCLLQEASWAGAFHPACSGSASISGDGWASSTASRRKPFRRSPMRNLGQRVVILFLRYGPEKRTWRSPG